jgi:hypothetical protein
MQNVPKIVRERLKAATPDVNHPEADVLTAFAERSLPELERGIVLDHLARCGNCRDIVALALPATEPIGEAATSPAGRRWLTWPALRWGLVAAGILAIASLGVVRYQHRGLAQMASKKPALDRFADTEAKNQNAPLPIATAPSAKQDKLQAGPSPNTESVTAANAARDDRRHLTREAPPVPALIFGSPGGVAASALAHGPRMPTQWQQKKGYAFGRSASPGSPAPPSAGKRRAENDLSANVVTPPADQNVEASVAAPQINTQAEGLESLAQDQPVPSQPAGDEAVGKAKAVVTPTNPAPALKRISPVPAPANGAMQDFVVPMPTWTITSTGGLQRSFDQGNSWQAVDVNAALADSSMSLAGATPTSRGVEKRAVKTTPKQPSATLVFRAVTAIAAEVWAGGSGGVLYHSTDAGNQWTRVVPFSAGSVLTGDIVSLEFADPQHGKITTSTGELWTTLNAGQTWQKQ